MLSLEQASPLTHHATPISIPSNPASNPTAVRFHQPRIKLVVDMGQNHPWRADNLIQRKHGI